MGERRRVILQTGLFIVTFFTTTLAGTDWTIGKSIFESDFSWADFAVGLNFSVPFLLILTVHEFGHYFTARYHHVNTSLPYYIPLPPIPLSIGTLGALIRMRGRIKSKLEHFDIGIAGPLAGLVVALLVLWYGFSHLPPPEYIFQIHPEYKKYGLDYAKYVYQSGNLIDVQFGSNLIMEFFKAFVADPSRLPNIHEFMHYPYLMAGYLALVVTSINLIPIGQLDGGHVLYGLFGFRGHRKVSTVIYFIFMFYAGLGFISPYELQPTFWSLIAIPGYVAFLYFSFGRMGLTKLSMLMFAVVIFGLQFLLAYLYPTFHGYSGWLLFGFIIGRLVGVLHPPAEVERPLGWGRKILGWFALLVFLLTFSPNPITLIQLGQ